MLVTDKKTYRLNNKSSFSENGLRIKLSFVYTVICIIIIAHLCGFYLRFAWNRYTKTASSEAVMYAQSLESFMNAGYIEEFIEGTQDLDNSIYTMLKSYLMKLAETTNQTSIAYFLGERDGNIVLLLDSQPHDTADYLPPGQVFEETNDDYREAFQSGNTILTERISGQGSSWNSVLVPIKDQKTGNIIAVLGIDYSASEWQSRLWKQMIPDIIVILSILVLLGAFLVIRRQHFFLEKLNKKLARSEALYRSVFDQAPIGIAIGDNESHVVQPECGQRNINPMLGEILGRNCKELENLKWTVITHPEDLKEDLEKFEQFKAGKIQDYSLEKRYLRPDGSSVWTKTTISHLLGGPERKFKHLCLIEDISNRKKMEESLRESERSKSVLLSHLPGMAYRCKYDRKWTMQFVSEGCFQLTGYTAESLLHNKELSFNDLIAPEYCDSLWAEWERIIVGRLPFKYEYEIITAKKERKWVLEMGQGIYNEQNEVDSLEGIILDISDRKEIENNLRYNNEHDLWTGLYNHRYLESLLDCDAKIGITKKRALVGINLSPVQMLSLNYGFHYSQELIKKAAEALSLLCNDKRQLYNTYENRFVFYVKDYEDKNELTLLCESVVSTLESVVASERIGGGIGIVEIDEDNKHQIDLLFKNLLIASEKALRIYDKDLGVCYFDRDMEAQIKREEAIKYELLEIESDADDGGLFLQYQPILDLKSNQICCFEALARIKSDKMGVISPFEFIPLAEKTKLIIAVGKKVILKAFKFVNKLKAYGYDKIGVSINISAIQLLRNDFVEFLFSMMDEMQINPSNVGIEITESLFADNYQEINRILGVLKDSGIQIAIDDFGTGYSSLARERELNVSCLKIDKYFIDKLVSLKDEEAITGDIISMAHKLGHYVIAEGVEHERQRKYLENNECDKIQGYMISKPLDEDAAIEMLKK